MSFENFEEYLSNNLKINDDNMFQEKIDLLLSSNKNKNEIIKKEKEKKEELKKQRKLKDESNEKKIDFILSDENSFEEYEKKLKEQKEDTDYNIDNIFFPKFSKKIQKDTESNSITNTDNLINNEKKGNDLELIKLNDDIKKNKPKIYNPKKIKKFKEMKDLKTGLEIKENNIDSQVQKKNNTKNENLLQKTNNNQINMNINDDSSSKKLIKNKLIKEIRKEIKKDENDEDLIMSLIQCPIQTCQKTKNNYQKKKQNFSINIEKKNINSINKKTINEKNNENTSLLNIYKKEKEMRNKLQKIFLNNQNVSKDEIFSGEKDNNQFYNFDSNSKFLSKAEEILLDDLSEKDKNLIKELENQINNVKKQISDINDEKIKYNQMIEEKKN